MNRLRPYQEQAVSAVLSEFERVRSTLVVAATGTGKTTIFSHIAGQWAGRVLVLCHRKELVDQAQLRLQADLAIRVGVDQAASKSTFERVVVASVQTVYRKERIDRLKRFAPPSLIIADEAHHAPSKSWRKVLEAFPGAKVLGVTATPDRGDGRAMGLVFDSVAYEYGITDAVSDGWLVPLRGQEVVLGNVDLDAVGVSAGDLAIGQLDEAMLQGAEGVAQGLLKYGQDMQGIVFCPGVKTAHFVADRLNLLKPDCAASVDGSTDPEIRDRTIQAFRDGHIQWLTNCMVFTEGTDLPTAQVAAIARPTKSRALYAQMVGRVSRCLPGVVDRWGSPEERRSAIAASSKSHGLILDFVGNNSRHALATPEDILGGSFSDEERKAAKKAREAGELGSEATVEDYLANARAQLKAAAAAIKRSNVQMSLRGFDPFVMAGVSPDNEERRLSAGRQAITEGQKRALLNMGMKQKEVLKLTRNGAKRVLDEMSRRRQSGLATLRQIRALEKYGVKGPSLTKEAATKAISYLAQTGWGRKTNKQKLLEIAGQ